ncbi:hypothetical protein GCM10008960_32370 [Deinococcus sedimenti]|uniref:Uncharacterized protein n=1 Tax=Deinococcus sedimenti TaxID=1867090 RepID=A0ABQ2S6Z3_9DEIO|nr:hypothetical protein GCM10008960_32370 [Deinococcus sedimenti]
MVRGTSPSTSEVVTPTSRRVWIVQSNPTPQTYAELQTAFQVQVWGKPGLNVACLTCNQPLSALPD